LEAWQRIYNSVSDKEKQSMAKNLLDFTEGTLGVAPEAIFRLLNLTDKPFRKATYNAVLSELVDAELEVEKRNLEAKKNLTDEEKQLLADINSGVEFKRRMVVSGEEITEQAKYEAATAVFQNKNPLLEMAEAGIGKGVKIMGGKFKKVNQVGEQNKSILARGARGIAKIVAATQVPFVNMPLNWATEVFMLSNPVVPLMLGAIHAKNGSVRKANQYFGKAVLGMVILQAASFLIKNGLVNGGGDDDDDKQKAATFGLKKGYNRLNYSGYKRTINGGSPEWKEGDYSFEYYQLGIAGAIIASHANALEKYGEKANILEGMFSSIRTSMNMPMVKEANALMDAISKGKENSVNDIIVNTANALKAVVVPATVTKSIAAYNSDEVLKTVRDNENVWNWIKNTYADQMHLNRNIPIRYNMWGEEIKKLPADRNAWVYYLFDITKGAEIKNSFGLEIYQLQDRLRMENPELAKDVLPSNPDETINYLGQKHKLTPSEYSEFTKIVGQNRKNLTSLYVDGKLKNAKGEFNYNKDTDEEKAATLKNIYEVSLQQGKEAYAALKGWSKEVKKKEKEIEGYSKKKLTKILKK